MSTTVSPETKLSRTLNKIQYCSLNSYPLKRELQQGMNNFFNTLMAFNKIATNKGAGTPGIDNETIDGVNLKKLERYHHEYVNNGYHPKPVKRILIPKGKGKTRPLGLPTIKDRLIQKCLEQLLTPYFEGIFSEWSFGFRTKKSCHDAIKRVKQRFKGIDYLVKIDLKGYFDTINHQILMMTLSKFIRKNKTLSTINKWLKAGFMKEGIKYESLSGSPQGGIISPLLANVYLHYIDLRMDELIKEGKPIWKVNPEYRKAWRRNQHHKLGADSVINLNPKPRVEYIRYADDFIIGIKGEYDQAERIKDQVTKWLEQDLKLIINKNKSKIVKASKGTRFLSYMVKIYPTNKTREKKTRRNSLNGKVQIQIPRAKAKEYGEEYNWLKKGKVRHDETLADRDELETIRIYQTIVRGIIRYFCFANNLSALTHLNYLAEYSCLKTLARKRKTSIARVRKKLNIGSTWGIPYHNKGKTQFEPWVVYSWDKIRKMRNYKENPDVTINKYIFQGRTHLTDRLKAEHCENCGETTQLQIHHIGTVRNAHYQTIMNKRTKVLCKDCHHKITNQQIRDIRKTRTIRINN
ncbi:MAG: reverse transcriptase domain-containing protein [Candidatus Phytoplasma australasiaticum]|nr:reverse transcriptase domain-containing protein [Candidatus Phytoplasma australasiaticum]MDV3167457.1 reverse transcriptase domain-containing protein [Candidatus Phytoplasma australasiaticum]MDV3168961.1 reverse transcriptase domain-containing protein [Candidatus Phytoplasma australasiaticum]MDV3176750.1 reverse transcriptase domain-containing protein [Candidatus Phytoplasma australasiaticum]MDV3201990.1 reverse transcriptase domain-containing protein [Candidatus Phytoplasma australasiaticum